MAVPKMLIVGLLKFVSMPDGVNLQLKTWLVTDKRVPVCANMLIWIKMITLWTDVKKKLPKRNVHSEDVKIGENESTQETNVEIGTTFTAEHLDVVNVLEEKQMLWDSAEELKIVSMHPLSELILT